MQTLIRCDNLDDELACFILVIAGTYFATVKYEDTTICFVKNLEFDIAN